MRPHTWQNNETDRESPALDAEGSKMDPFRNHVVVDVPQVVRLVRATLPPPGGAGIDKDGGAKAKPS